VVAQEFKTVQEFWNLLKSQTWQVDYPGRMFAIHVDEAAKHFNWTVDQIRQSAAKFISEGSLELTDDGFGHEVFRRDIAEDEAALKRNKWLKQ